MTSTRKLNLGCGDDYRPGYINTDKFGEVLDLKADALNIPFEPDCLDEIYASQLIEHFDYIHCKYLLSEWFVTLKPGGKLIIETPDLKRSYKKLTSADKDELGKRYQWMYGIDSTGMQHKIGFTYNILKDLLGEIGFVDITKKRQRTHRYEPGMRVECKKPLKNKFYQKFALFRARIFSKLEFDSYLLIPIEEWIEEIRKDLKDKKIDMKEIISKSTICNPTIPLVLIGTFARYQDKELISRLKDLDDENIHKKIFNLWIASKKTLNVKKDYESFIQRQKEAIKGYLESDEDLKYLNRLDEYDIDIFDLKIILSEAKKEFNKGVRDFVGGKYERAMNHFVTSAKMNYSNPLTHWNLARLYSILEKGKIMIDKEYQTVLDSIGDKDIRCTVKKEIGSWEGNGKVPNEPLPWQIS